MTLGVVLSVAAGTAAQSQTTEPPPITELGPYGVGVRVLELVDEQRENWTLTTTVWFPADPTQGRHMNPASPLLLNAVPDLSSAPYPLIIYSHAGTARTVSGAVSSGSGADLPGVNEFLASHGFVVAAADHHDAVPRLELVDRPLDIMLIMDSLDAITEGTLAGMIDTTNVGLMGYDQGAVAALQMLGLFRDPIHFTEWCAEYTDPKNWDCSPPPRWVETGQFVAYSMDAIAEYRASLGLQNDSEGRWQPFGDERIRAVLAFGACHFPLTTEDMLAAVTTPTMILYGYKASENMCDYENNAVRTYAHLGTDDRYLITMPDTDNDITIRSKWEVVQHFATAFFGYHLKSDEAFAAYLTPEGMPALNTRLVWGPYEGE